MNDVNLQFTAESGLFEATERRLIGDDLVTIDPNGASFERVSNAQNLVDVVRVDTGG